mgnify:CR=1 FL=1
MKELHLSIVSPEKSIFDGDVKIVTLPGMIGSFSILPGHAPIVSSLNVVLYHDGRRGAYIGYSGWFC